MIAVVPDLRPDVLAEVDTIIDVRSPSEFAEDHVPGAINLPVLDDAERAEVGTIYVQDDPFRARRLGAARVARNIARHLEAALAGRSGGWRPLVYCWRGGQRSHAMASVLSQVGWRTKLLRGGYRTYRSGVVRALYEATAPGNVVLLDGMTGAGKTEVLQRLATDGLQTIDLEALAEHRGSLLGALPGRSQPSQKMFESRLAAALARVDPGRPLFLEAESSKIGERTLPPALWAAMASAPVIELQASPARRAERLAALYTDMAQDRAALAGLLDRLPRHIGRADVDGWRALLEVDNLPALAQALIERHYDPAYARSTRRLARTRLASVSSEDTSAAGLDRVAACVVEIMQSTPAL